MTQTYNVFSNKTRLKKFFLKQLVASTCAIAIGLGLAYKSCLEVLATIMLPDKPIVTNSTDKQAVKILFIGNSFTFFNVLPAVLAEFIDKELHRPTKIYQQTLGGATLETHWKQGLAQRMIAESGPWDYVVLQAQSEEALGEKNQKNFYEYAKRFDSIIKANHATTILFETWADKGNKKAQHKITLSHSALGKQIGATVIPVGQSFFHVAANDKHAKLYDTDNHHPSQSGTYLTACMFYYYLFKQNASGRLPDKIVFHDEEQKKDFQVIALDQKTSKVLQDLGWKFYLSAAQEVKN